MNEITTPKFKNIKVGDTVMVEKVIPYGWNKGKRFYVQTKVARVTKTQFVTENGDRFKKDGYGLGNKKYSKLVYNLGDKLRGGEIVKDDSSEYNRFVKKLNIERSIISTIDNLKLDLNSHLTLDQLLLLENKIAEIKTILKCE